jgi:uncharacterized protein (DUF2384 family)
MGMKRTFEAISMLSPFLEEVIDPSQGWISPRRMSEAMRMPLVELSQVIRMHRNTLTKRPDSPDVQSRLGQVARIVARAAAMTGGNFSRAVIWFRFEPLAGFDHKTAEQLVTEGHAEAVETHLDMLEEGIYS